MDTPDFGHAFSNYTYFQPCGWIWFSSVRRARKLEGEKRRKKGEERIPGKHMSADILCRAAYQSRYRELYNQILVIATQ